jgi:hypothetical protein
MAYITSILEKITEKVFTAKCYEDAKQSFIDCVNNSNVKDKDKMLKEINNLKTLYSIQKYTANALLKYEGLGVSVDKKEA